QILLVTQRARRARQQRALDLNSVGVPGRGRRVTRRTRRRTRGARRRLRVDTAELPRSDRLGPRGQGPRDGNCQRSGAERGDDRAGARCPPMPETQDALATRGSVALALPRLRLRTPGRGRGDTTRRLL